MIKNKAELIKTIIDSLHWKEYTFIGQSGLIFEGCLTQESEELIANQILSTEPLATIIELLDETADENGDWQPDELGLLEYPKCVKSCRVLNKLLDRYPEVKLDLYLKTIIPE